jgi:hypothetical protein
MCERFVALPLAFQQAGYEAEAFIHRLTLFPGHMGALPQMRKCVNHVLGIRCKLSVDKLMQLNYSLTPMASRRVLVVCARIVPVIHLTAIRQATVRRHRHPYRNLVRLKVQVAVGVGEVSSSAVLNHQIIVGRYQRCRAEYVRLRLSESAVVLRSLDFATSSAKDRGKTELALTDRRRRFPEPCARW